MATADEIAAEQAAARTANISPFTRNRPSRQPFPAHVPRERVGEPAPATCLCCGSAGMRKLGEDKSKTLDLSLRSWRVIEHVWEKSSCRACEKVARRQRHSTQRRVAGLVPTFWPSSCSRSSACISR